MYLMHLNVYMCFIVFVLLKVYSKESFDTSELGPLSALLVGGQRARQEKAFPKYAFLHKAFLFTNESLSQQ